MLWDADWGQGGEDSFYQWDEALLVHSRFSHHGVGLSSPCLSVSEDADVVALKGVKQHVLPDVLVHPHLRGEAGIISLWTQQGQTLRTLVEDLTYVLPDVRPEVWEELTELWDQ